MRRVCAWIRRSIEGIENDLMRARADHRRVLAAVVAKDAGVGDARGHPLPEVRVALVAAGGLLQRPSALCCVADVRGFAIVELSQRRRDLCGADRALIG